MEPSALEFERIVTERQQVTKRFLGAVPLMPETVATVYEFTLPEQSYIHHDGYEIVFVKISRSVSVGEELCAWAEGYGWPLTMSGRRRANGRPQWVFLPAELAEAVVERMERA